MKIARYFSLLFFLSFAFLLSGCSIPFIGNKKKAALQVNSTPKATVFLNEQHVGQTPYFDENLKEGEFVVKLVPESSGGNVSSWEGRVKLVGGILTVVNRNLAALEEDTSGYVLTLEPIPDKTKSSLSVVSTPDKGIVTVDGEPKGFAPLSLDSIGEGDHDISVSLPGYQEQKIRAKAINGYKLMATVQLAKEAESEQEATESAELKNEDENIDDKDTTSTASKDDTVEKVVKTATSSANLQRPYVIIKSPDIGWVRVRAETSTSSEELAKVNDGEAYKLLDTTAAGWYQIEYAKDKDGWISGKYAEKYE